MATQIRDEKMRKIIAEAVFHAELNEFLNRELAEEMASGVEVRVTTTEAVVTEIPTKEEASPVTGDVKCGLRRRLVQKQKQ